jgi:chromosome segregation ATPase
MDAHDERELAMMEKQNAELELKLRDANDGYDAQKGDHIQMEESLPNEIDELRATISALDSRLRLLAAEKAGVEERLQATQQESANKSLHIADLKDDLALCHGRIDMLKMQAEQTDGLRRYLEESREEASDLLEANQSLKGILTHLNREVANADQRNSQLKADNNELNTRLGILMKDYFKVVNNQVAQDGIASSETAKVHLTVNINPTDRNNWTWAKKLRAALPKNAELDIHGTSADSKKLNDLMDKHVSDYHAQAVKIPELENSIQRLKNELATIKQRTGCAIRAHKSLADQLAATQTQYDLNVMILRDYEKKIRELEDEKRKCLLW